MADIFSLGSLPIDWHQLIRTNVQGDFIHGFGWGASKHFDPGLFTPATNATAQQSRLMGLLFSGPERSRYKNSANPYGTAEAESMHFSFGPKDKVLEITTADELRAIPTIPYTKIPGKNMTAIDYDQLRQAGVRAVRLRPANDVERVAMANELTSGHSMVGNNTDTFDTLMLFDLPSTYNQKQKHRVIPVNKIITGWFDGSNGVSKESNWSIANKHRHQAQDIRQEVIDAFDYGATPRNSKARKIYNQIRHQFPTHQGWGFELSVPVFDKKYEGHISLVARNQQTNQAALINFGVGNTPLDIKQQRARAGILQHLYQGMNPQTDVSSYIYDIRDSSGFIKIIPDTKLLNRMFYGGIRGIYSSIHPSKLGTKVMDAGQIAAAQALSANAQSGLRKWKGTWTGKTYTVLDIETDAGNDYKSREILSIGAMKLGIDPRTGEWVEVDRFQRVYKPHDVSSTAYNMSIDIHGLSPEVIKALRRGHGWPKYYNKGEFEALNKFIGEDVIVGHNSAVFDIPTLQRFGTFDSVGQLDTLVAVKNLGEKYFKGQKLHEVYESLFGRTMEQDGLTHHDSMSDVIATGKIFTELLKHKGGTIEKIKWIMRHPGHSLVERDEYLNSEIVTGMGLGSLTETGFKTYTEKDFVNMATDNLTPEQMALYNAGFDENDQIGISVDLPRAGDAALVGSAGLATTAEALRQFKESMSVAAEVSSNLEAAVTAATGRQAMMNYKSIGRALATDTIDLNEALAQYKIDPNDAEARNRIDFFRRQRMAELDILKSKQDISAAEQRQKKETQLMGVLQRARAKGLISEEQYGAFELAIGTDNSDLTAIGENIKTSSVQAMEERRSVRAAQVTADRAAREQERIEAQRGSFTDKLDTSRAFLTPGQYNELSMLAETTGSFDALNKQLSRTVELNKQRIGALNELGKIEGYNYMRWRDAENHQIQSVTQASRGFLPNFINRPLGYFSNALVNANNIRFQNYETGRNLFNAVGKPLFSTVGSLVGSFIAPGVGTIAGGAIGSAAGSAISGGFNAITQIHGNLKERQINLTGQRLSQAFNIMSGTVQLLLVPLRIFQGLLRTGNGILNRFFALMKGGFNDMNNLGNPLTGATGIAYPTYQNYQMLDTFAGLQNGTINGMAESFAMAQTALYSRGQLDTNRVVAASMLGVFSDVYAQDPGGFERTVDKLASRFIDANPEEQKRILGLAGTIDKSLPQLLQVMGDMGVRSISEYQNPRSRGMYWNPISAEERKRFRIDNYEYQSSRMSISNARMRFTSNIWESFGKEVMNGFTAALDMAASGDLSGLFNWAVNLLDTIIEKLKKATEKVDWTSLSARITAIFSKVFGGIDLSNIKSIMLKLALGIYDAFAGLVQFLGDLEITPTLKGGHLGLDIKSGRQQFEDLKKKTVGLWTETTYEDPIIKGLYHTSNAESIRNLKGLESAFKTPGATVFLTDEEGNRYPLSSVDEAKAASAWLGWVDKGKLTGHAFAQDVQSPEVRSYLMGKEDAIRFVDREMITKNFEDMLGITEDSVQILSGDTKRAYTKANEKQWWELPDLTINLETDKKKKAEATLSDGRWITTSRDSSTTATLNEVILEIGG